MAFCMGNFDSRFLPQRVKEAIEEDVPMYGAKFDGINSAGIRTYDAAGLRWERSSNSVAGIDDFASIAPFNVRECITQYNSGTGKREVLAYKGDDDWSSLVSAKTGDRMIEFPCFWYKRPSKWEFIISPEAKEGFSPSPMHYRNGTLYEKVRVTKYALNNDYVSQTGYSPRVSTNMNTFRTNLRAKGMQIMDYPTWCSLTMLMIVKYCNVNVQDTVGQGRSSGNSTIASGNADNVKGLDGSPTGVSVTTESVVTLGIENLYSNVWKYMDGLFGYNYDLYIKDVDSVASDPANSSELVSTYTKIGTPVAQGGDASPISDIAFDSGHDFSMFPTGINGTNIPTADNMWSSNGFNCVIIGGTGWNGSSDGVFCFDVKPAVGSADVYSGAMGIEYGDN